MVRRLKSDLRFAGETFPKRNILRVTIDHLPEDAPELALSRLLQRYRDTRKARLAKATKSQQAAGMLVVTSLQKRLLSSIEAFARTLDVHRRSVEKHVQQAHQAQKTRPVSAHSFDLLIRPVGSDDERADLSEDAVAQEEDAQMAAATTACTDDGQKLDAELDLLDQMHRIAQRHRYDPDQRLQQIIKWIRKYQCADLGAEGASWNRHRLLIFTEYTDTKRYLEQQLKAVIRGSQRASERIATFHGGIGEERREAIKRSFNADPDDEPLRILIATDAAREGVNLQNHCHDLFHFDVPWNPGRLEQRNGRIDRKLQKNPEVNCRYFVLPQRVEDRVLDVLVDKTKTIQQDLGSLSPVIQRRIEDVFTHGIDHHDADGLVQTLDQVDHDTDEPGPRVRTMRVELGHDDAHERRGRLEKRLGELRVLLDKSREWIGLDDRHFRDALSASLQTLGVDDGLVPSDDAKAASDPDRARWLVPRLHERKGADPTWAASLDTLRAPRKKGQSLAEWRREAPIRPVVFRDPGNLSGEVVHLHLEHRLVQRLLGRFLAMGFRDDDLSRACVLRTDEARPMVVLLGRLSLFGAGGARLHDEVLAAAAPWVAKEQRGDGKLRPVAEGDKHDVLRLVEEALAQPRLMESPRELRTRLEAEASRDVRELTPHLERRAEMLGERAERALGRRGEVEAEAMDQVLEAQRRRIKQQIDKFELEQAQPKLKLAFAVEEQRQRQADHRHWQARLDAIAHELNVEPARVRESYVVKARRVEPVGIVYLWPLSS